MSSDIKLILLAIATWGIISLVSELIKNYRFNNITPGNPPMKAKITKMTSGGYKVVVNHAQDFSSSYKGAVIKAKQMADADRMFLSYTESAMEIDV